MNPLGPFYRAIGAAAPAEIVFTSGTTESDNLALKGVARANRRRGNHLVTTEIEHPAVLASCRALEDEGFSVTYLPVDRQGLVRADDVASAIEDSTLLVSVMAANSEIGVVQPLAEIGHVCRERGVLFHTDAAQAVGKISIDVDALGIDLLSLTAHKLYGPKGVGALWVRRTRPAIRIEPLQYGGGHERGLRSGTLPVAQCVGLGEAVAIAAAELEREAPRLRALREQLWQRLQRELPDVQLNGDAEQRLPGNLNVSFGGVEGAALALALDEVAVSTGSACSSAVPEPSHVLLALGVGKARALSSLRFGLGRSTSAEQIERAADAVIEQVRRLRELR